MIPVYSRDYTPIPNWLLFNRKKNCAQTHLSWEFTKALKETFRCHQNSLSGYNEGFVLSRYTRVPLCVSAFHIFNALFPRNKIMKNFDINKLKNTDVNIQYLDLKSFLKTRIKIRISHRERKKVPHDN